MYLGFGVVFGHSIVGAADRRFAGWYGAMRSPSRRADGGAHLRLWLRCVAACTIAAAILGALILSSPPTAKRKYRWPLRGQGVGDHHADVASHDMRSVDLHAVEQLAHVGGQRCGGPRDGPPVVLLHGWPSSEK